MTGESTGGESFRRGDVVLAADPFAADDHSTRPWAIVNNERHPFDGDQYVTMALTTRTWYEDRIPLGDGDFRAGRTPAESSLVPHALASLQPTLVSDHVCRLARGPLDEAVEQLQTYLVAAE